jgi:hypothetical protein
VEQDVSAEYLGIDNLIGEGHLAFDGRALHRGFGVIADPPDYRDYYFPIDIPTAAEVSDIPSEVKGVRVVVVLEDRPGPVRATG